MSSPLSMLKKTRRTPLQGPLNERWETQKVPFRRNLLKEFQTLVEDDAYVDPNTPSSSHAPTRDVRSKKARSGAPPTDFELMSAMMQQVTMLEKRVKVQAQEIARKEKKISVLEEKLRLQNESESPSPGSRDDLERRCEQLQNQVQEMESFLNDYGLMWVGDRDSSDSAESELPHYAESGLWQSGTSVRNFNMNFDLVLQRIKELNVLAGEGESVVQTTAARAQLIRKDPVQLRLYSNGIVMFEGPFRSYQDHSTQQCMQDLMDGYFPSELRERFPDGVPLEVHDRRDEEFIVRPPRGRFPGEGRTFNRGREDSTHVSLSQMPGRKLTTHQFLNRLPKIVVKAGRVIDIRDSVKATLQGPTNAPSSDSVILVETPALHAVRERPSCRNIITIKVKSEDGTHTYILKMCLSETIGHLRQHLDKQRGGGQLDYDIISTYPHCYYSDDCQTLQSCGLTTNAILLLQKRKPHSLADVN